VATIREVARAAGVSVATVSRVWTGSSRVTEETSQRVREAAEKMGYWPHAGARSLTTRQTHTLGVLLPDLFGEFFSEVIRGIDQTARASGYQILVSSSHADAEEVLGVARALRGRVDGLIAMMPDRDAVPVLRKLARTYRIVLLNAHRELEDLDSVSIANREGASEVVHHLRALGHERIAFVRGPERNIDAEARYRGYRDAVVAAGLEADPALVLTGDFTEASGYAAGLRIADLSPVPTAVFAANDCMAVGCMSALRDVGLDIPAKVSLVGFDDIAVTRYLHPALTTVHVNPYELGRRAVARWFATAATDSAIEHAVVPVTLMPRGSTAPPEHFRSVSNPLDSPSKTLASGELP
jgi:LacI family transcriptional regulator